MVAIGTTIAQIILFAGRVCHLQTERNWTRCSIFDAQLFEQRSCVIESGRMGFGGTSAGRSRLLLITDTVGGVHFGIGAGWVAPLKYVRYLRNFGSGRRIHGPVALTVVVPSNRVHLPGKRNKLVVVRLKNIVEEC